LSVYRVAVFARNEERNITAALRALLDACPRPRDLKVFVLINGCTDRTPQVVNGFAAEHREVVPVELPIGDKCNAWNTYVYQLADDSPVHFFTDGDVTCSAGALAEMQEKLLANESAAAMAGWPLSGRHRQDYQRYIREWHWLYGNLYAARGTQLAKVRAAGVRLPLGLCANDHFITKIMAARSLDPTELNWEQNTYHPTAGYCFEPLRPWRWGDWKIYWRRRVTYTLRQLQIPELDNLTLTELPATMDAVNHRLLVRLEAARPGLTDILTRAVRRRLRRMYPTPDASYHDRWLPQSNHCQTIPTAPAASTV
jgi:glycosyltransferase involved in cell wall biosynthesis